MALVLAHGVFDLFHIGHLKYLQAARALGDRLIVTITADRFITKGQGRPLFPELYRKEILESLKIVDLCEILDEPTGISGILKFKPDIYAKGRDYEGKAGIIDLERKAVESYGGQLVLTQTEIMCSSTEIMTGRMLRDRIPTTQAC